MNPQLCESIQSKGLGGRGGGEGIERQENGGEKGHKGERIVKSEPREGQHRRAEA
jgi:hypothetical protein